MREGMVRTSIIYKAHVYAAGLLAAMALAVAACGTLWLWKVGPVIEAGMTADMLRVLCYEYDDAVKRGRSPSVQDLLAEIVGASVAMCWRDESGALC